MRVLILGSGGREHALAWKLKASKMVKDIFVLPGNGGILKLAQGLDIDIADLDKIADFAQENRIDLTVVGPEVPLVGGIADIFLDRGLVIFGPSKSAARLEGSKAFAKRFMKDEGITTADFEVFDDYNQAKEYVSSSNFPIVIKADGLCSGKGVFVVNSREEAQRALGLLMRERIFGDAGETVVIEQYLKGEEASIIVVSDGDNFIGLASAQDHKQIYECDKGPNTGGMGAYSPAPLVEGELLDKILDRVIRPTISGMKRRGCSFKGALYAGVMIKDMEPYVLEYNVRFGDPETQAILPRLKSDLAYLLEAAAKKSLKNITLNWERRACVSVTLASGGYPAEYEQSKEIIGLDKAEGLQDVVVFHAGTKNIDNKYFTSGGRVLNVTALGDSIKEAKERAYYAVEMIKFDKMYYRRDISDKALKREV
ncbi:MAG: phosphoribosylamine--glycine ligase [Candidatus Omnitrophica bacterium]|nr:phosphoribosylamine--glycine ligase [Candidatus Omnitrophota bacterium]